MAIQKSVFTSLRRLQLLPPTPLPSTNFLSFKPPSIAFKTLTFVPKSLPLIIMRRGESPVRLVTTWRDVFSESSPGPPRSHPKLPKPPNFPSQKTVNANKKAVFVVTYIVAVFNTLVGAEACNTTTLSVVNNVTEFVTTTVAPLTLTVTESFSGINGTSSSVPGLTGITTVTETTTLGGDSGSASISGMSNLPLTRRHNLQLTPAQFPALALQPPLSQLL